jgi:transposase-like protein
MAAAKAAKQRAPRRQWPLAQKRRLVELTLRAGASLRAIAREHGIHPNSLRQWKALHRAGKLDDMRARSAPASATFVPVSVLPVLRRSRSASREEAASSGVVQLMLASGASLRIEVASLDAALVSALVGELRR